MRVLIVGAGIGGLTAAIALQRVGHDVAVLEQAPELGEVGAGLTVGPNAVRALRRLGLGDELVALGFAGGQGGMRTAEGTWLMRGSNEDLQHRYGVPMLSMHRADLHAFLLRHAGRDVIRTGARCEQVTAVDGHVRVELADGGVEQADVLIGADGIHSAVRAALFGQIPLRYAGYAAWQGMVADAAAFGDLGTGYLAFGYGQEFGVLPVGDGRIAWWGTATTRETAVASVASELHERFAGWVDPIPRLIAATPDDAVLYRGLYELPAPPAWTVGRAALLGDAAHAMTPNLGQGACQAIEDAVVLAACLRHGRDPEVALRDYQVRRRMRVQRIVAQSRLWGALRTTVNPFLGAVRDLAFKLTPEALMLRALDPLLAWKPPVVSVGSAIDHHGRSGDTPSSRGRAAGP